MIHIYVDPMCCELMLHCLKCFPILFAAYLHYLQWSCCICSCNISVWTICSIFPSSVILCVPKYFLLLMRVKCRLYIASI
ncbi:hypothetical protein A4A49_04918 [Nicotiana attenuata]|uniref:Uncharacterized protein n=1 Tax=Nicotiana attenuata TaxID=49451 RepID=A0A1J6J8B4_NICAT|nr:hypothetical protein A4A49_04918 [Nicotiana attenuata]